MLLNISIYLKTLFLSVSTIHIHVNKPKTLYLSTYLFVFYQSIYVYQSISIYPYIYIYLSICLSIYLSIYWYHHYCDLPKLERLSRFLKTHSDTLTTLQTPPPPPLCVCMYPTYICQFSFYLNNPPPAKKRKKIENKSKNSRNVISYIK